MQSALERVRDLAESWFGLTTTSAQDLGRVERILQARGARRIRLHGTKTHRELGKIRQLLFRHAK